MSILAPPRIVLDTNVWLDLLVFGDPRVGALERALGAGLAVAVTDAACREEWRRVLGYPLLGLAADRQTRLRDTYDARAHDVDMHDVNMHDVDMTDLDMSAAVSPERPALPLCSDPDDQKFLQLAQAANARWLLTRDRALLKLDRRTRKLGLFEIMVPEAWPPPEAAVVGR